jgi:hypothetical protein
MLPFTTALPPVVNVPVPVVMAPLAAVCRESVEPPKSQTDGETPVNVRTPSLATLVAPMVRAAKALVATHKQIMDGKTPATQSNLFFMFYF